MALALPLEARARGRVRWGILLMLFATTVVNYADRLDNLRRLSGILLDAGVNDDYELQWGHRVLSHRLTEAGIAHQLTENSGNHGGRANERLQVALGWLGQTLVHD